MYVQMLNETEDFVLNLIFQNSDWKKKHTEKCIAVNREW